jgi:malate dehydrogenase (oxaloacetate-decarboxylating)
MDAATPMSAAPRFEERVDRTSGERYLAVFVRGAALKEDPLLNKGTAFTRRERESLGLLGLLPPRVATPEEQEARAWRNCQTAGDDLQRYLFMAALQDRNETLFCKLLSQHLEALAPVVYTPTVGEACARYSHIYRRARGLYVSLDDRGRIVQLLRNAPQRDVRVIVITDNEAILGIGDQGVGGMGIAIGKLALYSAGAGIHPAWCMPMDLDVGTVNATLLGDPLYLGARERRLRGPAYYGMLDELVAAISEVWPHALVQWEDFASHNAFTILERYRRKVLSFNDDIQGTGAVVVAGIRAALSRAGRRLPDERIVFYGAGASGAGSALAVRAAMEAAGLSSAAVAAQVLAIDSRGLVIGDRPDLPWEKARIACPPGLAVDWTRDAQGGVSLAEVVRRFHPTVLVGASGQPGAFTEEIVRGMHAACGRPIILPLSNPTANAEAVPSDILRWTNGAALVATGSPFPPVEHGGVTHVIGQGNNALVFPGLGLAAIATRARWLPDEAFQAASDALAAFSGATDSPSVPLYPQLGRLREVSRCVANAVGRALVQAEACAPLTDAEVAQGVDGAMWTPEYLPYRAG